MWQIVAMLCLMNGDIRSECHIAVIKSSYSTAEECSEAMLQLYPRLSAGAQRWMSVRQINQRVLFQARCEIPPAQA